MVKKPEDDLFRKLKWMMLFRLLFALLLLGGTIIYGANENLPYFSKPLVYIYWLTAWVILLSLCYSLVFSFFSNEVFFAYVQTGIDTIIATSIIFLTGSYASLFTFLYLIVIICASMLLSRKGSLIIAGLCCLEYGVMVDLEYYNIIRPAFLTEGNLYDNYEWNQVIYKMGTVMLACFLTMVLSSYLAEQERRAQSDLQTMGDQVKRMEKMAVVGEMASGLAHEIKNPLTSLSGSIQMLMESHHYDTDQKKLMTIVVREAERLNALVSDFLQFARPKLGAMETIEVACLLEETVSLFENNEKYKDKVTFIKDIEKNLWTEMDPGQLKQVILNLMLNAAEAMENNKGVITVTSYLHRDQFIRVKIIDDGDGMDEAIIPSIFDPFFTTKAKGTGLGLSIVLRILQAYNYQVDVKSEKHKGSTFTLKLRSVSGNNEN
ncbi:MAG: two-component sensor histidine kinase [Proteobacteria bacterium]|nr:two-component sensor histidine kinase [Pseudomonadota bacterium]